MHIGKRYYENRNKKIKKGPARIGIAKHTTTA
jgi:hypothetical protein